MRRALALLVFLLVAGAAFAQALRVGPDASPGSSSFAAPGGTASQSQSAREGRRLSIFDFANIYANTQAVTEAATINSGTPTTLTVASNTFAPGDVGKYIVVPFAGAQISWLGGSVTSVPVATNGAAYTAVPTVSFNGSPLSAALAQPLMQITGASDDTAGAGCTPGTYSVAVNGGKYNTTQGVISVTVGGGGTVSSVSTTAAVGDYFQLPTLTGNAPNTIAGCSIQPTFNLVFNVGSVFVQWGGNGYSLTAGAVTATLSGGSPGTAATLGTVLTSPFIAPLPTTIAGYVSPTQVTLAAAASSFLAAQSVRIVWGNDDCPGIAAAEALLPAHSALKFPYANYGCFGTFPYPNTSLKIEGDGTEDSVVYEFEPTTALFQKGTGYTIGGVVRDMMFDGNRLAQFTCEYQYWYQVELSNVFCMNAATPTASGAANYTADVYYGPGNGQIHSYAPYGRNDGGLYLGSGDLPTYNFWVNSSDNTLVDPVGVNATEANFRLETSTSVDTYLTNAHGWGSIPGSPVQTLSLIYAAQNCFEVAASSWLTEPGCDIARNDGVYVTASIVHGSGGHLLGSQVQASSALFGNVAGLEIGGGLSNLLWRGYDAGGFITTNQRVKFDTPYPTSSDIFVPGYGQGRVNLGQGNTETTATLYGVCAGSFSKCNGGYGFNGAYSGNQTGQNTSLFGGQDCDFTIEGAMANGYGQFNSTPCTAQSLDLALVATTTGATGVLLTASGNNIDGNYNQIPVPTISGQNTTTTSCRASLVGVNQANGVSGHWLTETLTFKNVGGTVSQVGSTSWTYEPDSDSGSSTWVAPTPAADNTNKMITLTLTGEPAGTTINWLLRAHCLIN